MPPEPTQDLPSPHPDFDGRRMKSSPSLFAKIARWWCPASVTLEPPACTVARYALRLIDPRDRKGYTLEEVLAQLSGVTSVAGKTGTVTLVVEDIGGLQEAIEAISTSPHGIVLDNVEDAGEGFMVTGAIPLEGHGLLVEAPDTIGGGSIPTGRACWTDDGSQVTMQDTTVAALSGTWRRAVYQAEDYWRSAYKSANGLAYEYFAPLGVHSTPDTVTGWEPSPTASVGGYTGYGDATGDGPTFNSYASEGTPDIPPGQIIRRSTDGSYFIRRPGPGPIRFDRLR